VGNTFQFLKIKHCASGLNLTAFVLNSGEDCIWQVCVSFRGDQMIICGMYAVVSPVFKLHVIGLCVTSTLQLRVKQLDVCV